MRTKFYSIVSLFIILSLMTTLVSCKNNAKTSEPEGDKTIYKIAYNYLEEEFHKVYDPYYDIQSLTISNWDENGNEATFFYKMTYLYYNRDPDTAEYIQKAKEEDSEKYEYLYEDYLKEHESNYQFKIVIGEDGNIELYSNVAPKGVEWQPITIGEYILGNDK